jgi:hypothetical protein
MAKAIIPNIIKTIPNICVFSGRSLREIIPNRTETMIAADEIGATIAARLDVTPKL